MLKWSERTFGMELEFADVSAEMLDIPSGYYIDTLEEIVNSNGVTGKHGIGVGVEICSPPILPSREKIRELRKFIKNADHNKGIGLSFDCHLYIGDLDLDGMKKIAKYIYTQGAEIYKVFGVPKYLQSDDLAPLLSCNVLSSILKAESIEQVENSLRNSSNKGYLRTVVSLASFFKHKTLEFRCFYASNDFRRTLETIKFMYSFLDEALKDSGDSVSNIVNLEKLPIRLKPMIITGKNGFDTSGVNVFSRKLLTLVDDVNAYDVRGGFDFMGKANVLFLDSYFGEFIIKVAEGEMPQLDRELEFLQGEFSEQIENNVLVSMFVFEIATILSRKNKTGEERCELEFLATMAKQSQFYELNKPLASAIVAKVQDKKIRYGGLKRVAELGKDVLMIGGHKAGSRLEENYVRLRCDNIEATPREQINYRKFAETYKDRLKIISLSPYLDFTKIGVSGDVYLYSMKDDKKGITKNYDYDTYCLELIEDGQLDKNDKVEVFRAKGALMTYYRSMFIKKVMDTGKDIFRVKFPFVVMVNDKVLGFFGIEFPDEEGKALMISDFVVNHDFKKGAKLVLMLTKLAFVRKVIERTSVKKLTEIETHVYTSKPVSMKYRGVYKKSGRDEKGLIYSTKDIGLFKDCDKVKEEFIRKYV
ncbi:hypothetical protein HN803_08555 [candidate division WWE3 bacterium]|jgi:hypothetical protein|nr:hypothetical protein [candidate division WWE3 bacterium]